MDATFFLSNIVPQDLDNNANYWYRLEAYCRGLTKRYSSVYIVSGPLYLPKQEDGKKIVKYEVCLVSQSFWNISSINLISLAEPNFYSRPMVPKLVLKKKIQSKVILWYHVKVLQHRFHLNGHIVGFYPETDKLKKFVP